MSTTDYARQQALNDLHNQKQQRNDQSFKTYQEKEAYRATFNLNSGAAKQNSSGNNK